MNPDLLIDYDEYKKLNRPTPYFFIVKGQKQVLYYFGARHSYIPTDKQFSALKKFWNKFLNETKKQNCIVFVEGGKRPIAENEKAAIENSGEAGFITFLAVENHTETLTPEPDQKWEREELLKKFSKEEVEYYYFARTVDQWHRRNQKPDFEIYIQPFLERDQRISQWLNFDFSLDKMRLIHKSLFRTDFNKLDNQFFAKIVNPMLTVSIINNVAKNSGKLREIEILREVERFWNNGKNIFIVYGQTHAVIQEPVIKTLA